MAEAWYTFPAQMGDYRAFIAFDYGFTEIADTDSRKFLFKVRVTIKTPTDAGLPTNEEFPALTALDDALDRAVTNKGGIYVGRVTVKGFRHLFYYVDFDEKTADEIVTEASNHHRYELDWAYVADPAKDGYWNDLYPTTDDWQVIRDMGVLDRLREAGDNPNVEREVQHWAFFSDVTSAEGFAKWLRENQYAVSEIDSDSEEKIKVKFSHSGLMTLEAITRHTILLSRKLNEIGGEYDGWETSVERSI